MVKKRKQPQSSTPNSSKKRQQTGKGSKQAKPKAKVKQQQRQDVPLPGAAAASDDPEQLASDELEVSDEDVEFVQQYGAQLGFLQKLNAQELDRAVKAKQQQQATPPPAATTAAAAAAPGAGGSSDVDSDDDAADYERRPRAAEQQHKGPSTQGLPVKTSAGEVLFAPNKQQQQRLLAASKALQVEGVMVQDELQQQKKKQGSSSKAAAAAADGEEVEEEEEKEEEEDDDDAAAAAGHAVVQQQTHKAPAATAAQADVPAALLSLMSIADAVRRREALKQQIALAAQHLLAQPEAHITPGLKLLSACAADSDGVVVRLALLSLLAVFKDLLPGYRIRPPSEEEAQMRVSKEVQALREFESTLLKGYQAYLKTLLAAATTQPSPGSSSGSSSSARLATARVAVRCMAQLLVAKPGFNYSSDLLQALVPHMVSRDGEVSQLASGAVQQLLQEDLQGKTSLEAVQLVADLVRQRRCVVDPSVVSVLLVLRFEAVTPTQQGGEGVGRQGAKVKQGRKRGRKKSDLERDLEEAEAAPDVRELALLQSQMLEALFEVFFRVLKHCNASTSSNSSNNTASAATAAAAAAEDLDSGSSSGGSSKGLLLQPWPAAKVHRKFPLLQPTLSGLGRYSHLISVEYFNDLMAVLQELLSAGVLPLRERLCVLLAALDILRGQGEALTIDRRAFYNHLYNTLLLAPLAVLYEGMPNAGSSSSNGAGHGNKHAAAAAAAGSGESEQELLQEVQRARDAVRISQFGWEVAATNAASSGSSRSQPPLSTPVLLLRCLEQQLLGVKQTDMCRLAAFVKRLAGLMLSSGSSAGMGVAALLWRTVKRYPKLLCLLEWEGGAPVGGQQYNLGAEDPSEAGAMAAALWELPLLTQHYHPHLNAAAKLLLGLSPGHQTAAAGAGGDDAAAAAAAAAGGGRRGAAGVGAVVGVIAGALGPQQVAAAYGTVSQGGFRPGPIAPPGFKGAAGPRGKGGAAAGGAGSSKAQMAARTAAAARPLSTELLQAVQQDDSTAAAAAAAAGGSLLAAQLDSPAGQQHRKRQRLQAGSNGVAGAAATSAAAASLTQLSRGADAVDMCGVQAALQQQYNLSKQYRRNQQLRREAAVAAKKVEVFREHLINKHQQQQAHKKQHQQAQKQCTTKAAGQAAAAQQVKQLQPQVAKHQRKRRLQQA